MEGRFGLVPAHLIRISGFPEANSMVWDWSESELACDVRKSATCL